MICFNVQIETQERNHMEIYSRVEDSELRSITIHIIFLSIYYRNAIYRFIILYYPIIR